MIAELIESLQPNEREGLNRYLQANPTQLSSFIRVLLAKPRATTAELQRELGLTRGTVFKNVSLAKDVLYTVIKQEMRNPYDDLLLPHVLYKRGLSVHAAKQRLKIENEYEQHGWWNILQETYNYELLVAYGACDVEWLKTVEKKAAFNIERLRDYVLLSNRAIVLMATIERGDVKPKDVGGLEREIRSALRLASTLRHPVPHFNLLHSLFVLYTTYHIDVRKAGSIIRTIHSLVEEYDEGLIPYARSVAWLNSLGFYADFVGDVSPLDYWHRIESAIGHSNPLYDAQALLSFCSYHFFEADLVEFRKYYARFKSLPFEKTFLYKQAYLDCLHAYLRNDRSAYSIARDSFYRQEENRAYRDYDLIIRYLEVLLLARDGERAVASDKLKAAIKFARRNFSHSRIEHEKVHWDILHATLRKRKPSSLRSSAFRLTRFLQSQVA